MTPGNILWEVDWPGGEFRDLAVNMDESIYAAASASMTGCVRWDSNGQSYSFCGWGAGDGRGIATNPSTGAYWLSGSSNGLARVRYFPILQVEDWSYTHNQSSTHFSGVAVDLVTGESWATSSLSGALDMLDMATAHFDTSGNALQLVSAPISSIARLEIRW